jgi:indole-3-glycerol phosphate synthase
MATSKKTLEQQIADAKKRLETLQAKAKSEDFKAAIAKNKAALNTIFADLKKASGKQRGVDSTILAAVAEAVGMKGMKITKRVQQRKK